MVANGIDFVDALKSSTAHEIGFLKVHNVVTYAKSGISTDRDAFMTLENLMDVWNNKQGANAAMSGQYSNYDQAFRVLLKNGALITSPEQVAEMYGFDPAKMTKGISGIWGFNVTFDYSDGIIMNTRLR